jgi:hypothetical protein
MDDPDKNKVYFQLIPHKTTTIQNFGTSNLSFDAGLSYIFNVVSMRQVHYYETFNVRDFCRLDFCRRRGKGKTKERGLLANPYRMNSRRDVLLESIREVLKERKILIDEAASRPNNGILVTQPFVFAKGAVISQNEINRYAVLDPSGTVWTRGQYTLTIEVQSIDGVQNNVSVTAKVEGRSGNGLGSEWTTLQSSGIVEDEFLAKLVETVTGISPDAPQTEIP